MGDMGDLFNDLKDIRKTQRASRSTQAAQMLDDVRAKVDSVRVDENGTWNVVKGTNKVQFYPTKGTWQFRNRILNGGIFSFINWLEKL
jgi:hypothetical protein